jgi:hypothetical protein
MTNPRRDRVAGSGSSHAATPEQLLLFPFAELGPTPGTTDASMLSSGDRGRRRRARRDSVDASPNPQSCGTAAPAAVAQSMRGARFAAAADQMATILPPLLAYIEQQRLFRR